MNTTPIVRVGVATLIVRDGKEVLFGLRKGSHGAGTWALPGGHVDYGEHPRDTVYREIKEENGLDVALVAVHKKCPWGHAVWPEDNKQYVTLFFTARHIGGEPKILEPNKCVEWRWFPVGYWPDPLFGSLNDPVVRELLTQGLKDL